MMGRSPLLLLLTITALATVPAIAPPAAADVLGPSVVKPYLFNPPDRPDNPLDQQKALIYRDQLRTQQRDLELRGAERRPLGADRLRETRRELFRMDNIINNRPPVETQITPPIPQPRVPAMVGVTGGGGRPQPTPAEVERRRAERSATGKAPPVDEPLTPAETEHRLAAARAAGRLPLSAPELEPATVPGSASSGPKYDLFGRRLP
jgi:hypothetical protein